MKHFIGSTSPLELADIILWNLANTNPFFPRSILYFSNVLSIALPWPSWCQYYKALLFATDEWKRVEMSYVNESLACFSSRYSNNCLQGWSLPKWSNHIDQHDLVESLSLVWKPLGIPWILHCSSIHDTTDQIKTSHIFYTHHCYKMWWHAWKHYV